MIDDLNVKLKKKLFPNKVKEEDLISKKNYDNLEKVLQKYEAEIREHIRVE